MGILLAFAPFIAFAVLDRLVGPVEGLIAGALVSATMLLRDWMSPGKTPKILEVGTVLLFGGLALYAVAGGPTWSVLGGSVMVGSVMGVRLLVDAGLLLIVLISIALRRPFTLQYAREQVAHEFWESPHFIHTNYVITGVWALAFLVLVIADLILLYRPDLPPRFGIVATVLALVGAIKFTSWYPERRRSAAGTV
ncbi:hypothetical protein D3869_19320 (plasmid) [Azospirillum brasilense]|uniref:Intracellular septation protein A n=1 Tax=Azospirillum brasilense TaxID=192 RepID=A0A4D8R612_AZOBR|nr:hypothetical protein [Azospirillum brasilense]QCO17391.1 hypothetical protein D3869_19320 [Azospirillum brasilense]